MNIIFWIILVAVMSEFLLGSLSVILNLRSLKTSPPVGLEDVFATDEYQRSQEYTRVQSRFGLLVGFFDLVILVIFWFGGGFNYIDQEVRAFGFNGIITGILFVGVLLTVNTLIKMPFSLYGTFVIEERFGFNKTTYITYLIDTVKGTLVSAAILIPLLAGVLYFFEYTGSMAWLYVFTFLTLTTLFIQVIAPVWIMPIFNKFTPLDEGELRDAIIDYASKVNFKFGNIYVIDGSRRSAHSNAFFAGFGKTKRIALFDTLIDQLTTSEIVSVIAHEVGHNKKRHIISGVVLGILQTGIFCFLLSLFIESKELFDAFFMEETSIYASLLFFGLLITPINLIIGPVMAAISRKHEYEADHWAVETTEDRNNLIEGLKKLAEKNLSNLSPHPFFVILNYSHPPLLDRINTIRETG
jgi:STE24 endopeptidase